MTAAAKTNPKFEALLGFLRQTRGFDFTGYKRPSLLRRINSRMGNINIRSYDEYMDYLEVHPEEFGRLFNSILINVTSFFRDAPAWDYLAEEVVPKLLESKGPEKPIRVWSAGCASGEEAYTAAMVLAEVMGTEPFQERVKIYATDVDEEALAVARHASYTEKDLEVVPVELKKRYFESNNTRYGFRPDLRRSVIFGHHDLIQDAPISRLDLLVCRNTLMYFNAETQTHILNRFHFALNRNGFLFLGKGELLLSHAKLFNPLDTRNRIFSKVENATVRDQVLEIPPSNNVARHLRLRDAALETSPLARIVIDSNGHLVFATQRARSLFGLVPKDMGRPINELEIYYRPADLRSLIEPAYAERRTVTLNRVERHFAGGETQYLDVHVSPLWEDDGTQIGVSVAYIEVTHYVKMQEELQHSTHELETTSEELQSTNEELETTNEELQSTNEELETMNEELQSTNEELHTVNEEMRQRTDELNNVNAFLNSILSSMRAAMVVLDSDMIVLIWNQQAENLWGLRSEEVQGKSFMNLDIGLAVEALRKQIRACITGDSEYQRTVVDAVNRRGQKIKCCVTCSRFVDDTKKDAGAVLLMEELD